VTWLLVSEAGESVDAAEQDGEAEARDKEGSDQRGGKAEEEAEADGRGLGQPDQPDQVLGGPAEILRGPAESDDEHQRRGEEEEQEEEDFNQRLQETNERDERRQDPGRPVLKTA